MPQAPTPAIPYFYRRVYLHALSLHKMDKLSASFFTWFAPHSREAARLASLQLYHEIHEIRKFLLRLNRRIHFLLDKHLTAGNPVAPPNPHMEMSTFTFVAQLICISPAPVTVLCYGPGEHECSQVTQSSMATNHEVVSLQLKCSTRVRTPGTGQPLCALCHCSGPETKQTSSS